jgi:hypothetical protein
MAAAAAPLAIILAGCGTTVPQSQQGAAIGLPDGTSTIADEGPSEGPTQLGSPSPGDAGPNDPTPSTPASGPASTTGTSTGPGVLARQPQGPGTRTAITKPLTVGLLGPGAVGGASGAIGAGSDQGVTPSQALTAVAESYRNTGGVSGRPLRTVLAELDPSGDYQQQLNQACAKFTQDNHVDVVVSIDAPNDDIMSTCLTKARIPRISTGYGSGNAASVAKYPYSRHVGAPNADRRMATLITRSAAADTLTKKSRVGVVVEGCPGNRSVYDQTVLPALNRLGVASTSVQYTDCITGFGNAGAASSETASAVLRFASRQVDNVMFVSNFEGTLLLFFSQAAEQQGYHPQYLLTSAAGVAALQSSLSAKQVVHMRGWGWLTATDQTRGNRASTDAQRSCVKRLAAGGGTPRSNIDYLAAFAACDAFTAHQGALQASRGDSSASRLLSGLDAASSSLTLASLVDGRVALNDRRHDGPARVRPFSYQSSCNCFAYVGPSQDMSP